MGRQRFIRKEKNHINENGKQNHCEESKEKSKEERVSLNLIREEKDYLGEKEFHTLKNFEKDWERYSIFTVFMKIQREFTSIQQGQFKEAHPKYRLC
jgi:hypothetical protein